MRKRWYAVPLVLVFVLGFILFVPVVRPPGDTISMSCHGSRCVQFVQYESISYAYGGSGAIFLTGVNQYSLTSWVCMCPADSSAPCCAPPYTSITWPALGLLFVAVLISLAVVSVSRSVKVLRKQTVVQNTDHTHAPLLFHSSSL